MQTVFALTVTIFDRFAVIVAVAVNRKNFFCRVGAFRGGDLDEQDEVEEETVLFIFLIFQFLKNISISSRAKKLFSQAFKHKSELNCDRCSKTQPSTTVAKGGSLLARGDGGRRGRRSFF